MATRSGALLQADTVHWQGPDGRKLYVYTLIDLFSRWAYAEVAERLTGDIGISFIERAMTVAPFRFELIQTDHGPEWQKMFQHRLASLGIGHRYSRVRQCNDNAHVERFNRTIQEECLDQTTATVGHYRQALARYLPYYNNERLHMGLNYQTPAERIKAVPSS